MMPLLVAIIRYRMKPRDATHLSARGKATDSFIKSTETPSTPGMGKLFWEGAKEKRKNFRRANVNYQKQQRYILQMLT
jgi:hypothetical protein